MEHLASYCLTEPGAGSDAAALTTQRAGATATITCSTASSSSSPAPASRDLYVLMARTGGEGAGGHLRLRRREGHAGPLLRRQREEDGLERAADPPGDPRRLPRAGREPARRRRASGFKIAMAGLDGGRLNIGACSLGGAQAALDKALRLHARAQGLRQARSQTSRRCSSGSPTWRPSWRPPARLLWRAAAALDAKAPDAHAALRHGQALRHRCRLRRRQRRAAAARRLRLPRRLRRSRRSCATCGCTRSWKAPTRSCGVIIARSMIGRRWTKRRDRRGRLHEVRSTARGLGIRASAVAGVRVRARPCRSR